MEREIKLRIWDHDSKCWRLDLVHLIEFDEDTGEMKLKHQGLEMVFYTGQKDRNGRSIFEGDIVRYPDVFWHFQTGDFEEIESVGNIVWDNDVVQFDVNGRDSISIEDFWNNVEQSEIIGNIYENPDLHEANL